MRICQLLTRLLAVSHSLCSIARYTVDSLFLPHSSESPKREIRVRGDRLTWNELIQIISDAQGIEYRQNWIDPSEAHKKAEEARVQEDEETELLWSIKAVAASGFAVASASPAQLSNELFSFKAESARQIYKVSCKTKSSSLLLVFKSSQCCDGIPLAFRDTLSALLWNIG